MSQLVCNSSRRHPPIVHHRFPEPKTVAVDLGKGARTAILKTVEVLYGPPLRDDPYNDILIGYRKILISLEFANVQELVCVEVLVVVGNRFRWCLPDEAVEVLVKTEATRLNGKNAADLISLEIVGNVRRLDVA